MRNEFELTILYDVVTKGAVVLWHDQMKMLGPFESQKQAVSAAEDYARAQGWMPSNGRPDASSPNTKH
jgi:hypothetical protein